MQLHLLIQGIPCPRVPTLLDPGLCQLNGGVVLVQPLCIFADDDHVDLARFPDLSKLAVNFVSDAFIEFDGSDICIKVQTTS